MRRSGSRRPGGVGSVSSSRPVSVSTKWRLRARNVALVDRCGDCGFEYALDQATGAGAAIVDGAAEIATILRSGGADLGTRRRPDEWSPLEYGCHLRDVLLVQRERVLEARRTDRPSIAPMGRDERVEHDGYAQQDP